MNVSANQPTDYWSLGLRKQAYEYVPKLIALSQIVADPDKYGVNIPPVPNRPSFEVADPGLPLNLAHAAELAEIDVSGFARPESGPIARHDCTLSVNGIAAALRVKPTLSK